MKRAISMILVIALSVTMLAGCCISHDWVEADCTAPKTCAKCEKTEGEALGHDWVDATCVAPKTCGRCGETEGEALGHDWKDADCENAKTCGRCGETEGEALGHSYSAWTAAENETMTSTCASCGDVQEQPIDREFLGRQGLLGKWELVAATINGMWFDISLGWTFEFFEDGTFVFITGEEEKGEYVYLEFYEGENMDFYVFDATAGEHVYNVNYEPAEDIMFVAGSEFFQFERVAE